MSPSLHASLMEIFDWVIRGSIMAGILVVLVLTLQFLLKNKLGARWTYLLWLPVVIRLLLPWAPESSLSLYNMLPANAIAPELQQSIAPTAADERWQGAAGTRETAYDNRSSFRSEDNNLIVSGASMLSSHDPYELESSRDNGSWLSWNLSVIDTFMLVWLAGVLVLTLKTIYDQLRLKRALRAGREVTSSRLLAMFEETKQIFGVKRDVRFIASGHLPEPAAVGFFKPAVAISPTLLISLKQEQLQYILGHELAHIKRWDVAVNWILHIVLILHWFNPLLWLALHRARQDQEMACDACVLDRLGSMPNHVYGQTIIQVLEYFSGTKHRPGLAALSATHKQMKKRLLMIKHFRKKSYQLSVFGIATIVALSSVTLVDAKSKVTLVEETSSNALLVPQAQAMDVHVEQPQPISIVDNKVVMSNIHLDDKKFIDNEIKRVEALVKESGDGYAIYFKDKQANNGHRFNFYGDMVGKTFSTYEDYINKVATLESSTIQQPANLPEGFEFTRGEIRIPLKFYDDLRAEGKKSGKPVFTKKFEWKETAIQLAYTNGKDELILNQYTAGAEYLKLKGFEYEQPYDKRTRKEPDSNIPKYVFWYGTGKYYYSISTTSDMTREQMIEILKASVKK
ncbi:M56 family metallopeptidase [Paenibacillus arenosi]|uniref:M56 family metallopeptidase n=1 Tax=Paenibacillus arenosi TaxID=2774142 RepID=A0ABR9AYR9_9BACL|nr:M56 family metallopeptidase [Paenibacillus arenosi]MBD8499167.1 M56 family metallopeptidase [Paenibacillus arenosi]